MNSRAQATDQPELTGVVVFPDGTPVEGAKVETTQDCYPQGDSIEIRNTTSAPDGGFSIPAFDPKCRRYRFSARKEADYWLPTDEFLGDDWGTPSGEHIVATFSRTRPPQPVRIVMNLRGGKVAIRVRDVSTGRFVYADLDYQREPKKQYKFAEGLMPTGLDGSATVQLLPPGEYSVEIGSFTCGTSDRTEYMPAYSPKVSIGVKPAIELNEVIEIDSSIIKVLKNDRGKYRVDSTSPACGR